MKKVIPDLFLKSAEEHGENIAFNFFDGAWKKICYKELLKTVKSITSHLINTGINKGDRVAIIAENRPEWCMAYLAISMSGAIAVPIDAQLGPDEIKNLLSDSESKIVFYTLKTEENVRKAAQDILKDYPSSVTLINFDSPNFKDIFNTDNIKKYPDISDEDVASIIYTSGTTGTPKGVELTHKNFCSDTEAIIDAELVTKNDNILSILPLHHTYPFTCTFLTPVFLGITITYPPSLKGPELLATIREKSITVLVGVPQLFERIRDGILNKIKKLPSPLPKIMSGVLFSCGRIRQVSGINLGKIFFHSAHKALGKRFRFFACGGAKLDPQIMKDLEALGFTVLEGYGLTETSPVVTFNPIAKRKAGSVGKPLPSVDIKIIDTEKNKELDIMQEGEIVIKGPMVMKGYYRNLQATTQVLKDGWLYTGDLGYLDSEGYLFITGRLKEVIVLSSGKNIYPDEVEKEYLKSPLIKEICVMGIEEKGIVDSLHAVIVPDMENIKKEQIGNLKEAIKSEINNISIRTPQYMRIKGFTLTQEPLPKTPLGKLRRFMVKDLVKVESEKLKVKRQEDKKLLEDDIGRKVVECLTPLVKEKIPIQSTDSIELDLGLDSLARIELVVCMEKAFSMKLPETFVSDTLTVEELVKKIKAYGVRGLKKIEKTPEWSEILKTEPDINDRKKAGLQHSFLESIVIFIGLSILKVIMKVLFRLKVKGLENIPEKGPFIITPNHTSYLDGFCVISGLPAELFKGIFIIGIQKYFTGRFKGSFARLAHVIPIDPEAYLFNAMQMASYVLQNGKSLLIFPEGGRSLDGELMEFKKGVGILSIELNVPAIPTFIKGSFEALPRGAYRPKFKEINIIFGKPFYPSDLDMSKKPKEMDNYQFFADELRERVKNLESN